MQDDEMAWGNNTRDDACLLALAQTFENIPLLHLPLTFRKGSPHSTYVPVAKIFISTVSADPIYNQRSYVPVLTSVGSY